MAIQIDEEELCKCGMDGCNMTLKEAEEDYRTNIIISTCALYWRELKYFHKAARWGQKRYDSFDDFFSDPRASRMSELYSRLLDKVRMKVDEELWKIDEYKKTHGRYAGMEKGAYKDGGTESTKVV